jgi:hypothetical protein
MPSLSPSLPSPFPMEDPLTLKVMRMTRRCNIGLDLLEGLSPIDKISHMKSLDESLLLSSTVPDLLTGEHLCFYLNILNHGQTNITNVSMEVDIFNQMGSSILKPSIVAPYLNKWLDIESRHFVECNLFFVAPSNPGIVSMQFSVQFSTILFEQPRVVKRTYKLNILSPININHRFVTVVDNDVMQGLVEVLLSSICKFPVVLTSLSLDENSSSFTEFKPISLVAYGSEFSKIFKTEVDLTKTLNIDWNIPSTGSQGKISLPIDLNVIENIPLMSLRLVDNLMVERDKEFDLKIQIYPKMEKPEKCWLEIDTGLLEPFELCETVDAGRVYDTEEIISIKVCPREAGVMAVRGLRIKGSREDWPVIGEILVL